MIVAETLSRHSFRTALGWIALVWGRHGVKRLCLPDEDRERTERRAADGLGGAPADQADLPDAIASLRRDLLDYAEGARIDFGGVAVDLRGVNPGRAAIYAALRKLPHGETLSYGELAARVGGAAREIGAAMGRNPVPIVIPCHRVTAAGGRLGGFSAPGGAATKRRLLALERAAPGGGAQLLLALN